MLPVFSYFLFGFSKEQNTRSSVCAARPRARKEGFWAQALKWKSHTAGGRIRMGVETKARNPQWKGQSWLLLEPSLSVFPSGHFSRRAKNPTGSKFCFNEEDSYSQQDIITKSTLLLTQPVCPGYLLQAQHCEKPVPLYVLVRRLPSPKEDTAFE